MTYYTPLIIIVLLSLAILCILTKENDRFSKEQKRIYYFTFAIVAAAALSEWTGIQLKGNTDLSPWVLRIVKFFDYVLTPLAGGALALQFRMRTIWRKILLSVIAANMLFQIVSVFTGWMITIDERNTYHHGPLYIVYMLFYVVIVLLVILEFAVYGKQFRKHNLFSLYATLVFTITGIAMQELLGSEVRTAYISLVIGIMLLVIHKSEYEQIAADDRIQEQMVRISVDQLTGIASRYAYTSAIQELAEAEELPSNLVVFSIDINGLKTTNDTLGHSAGDELIRGAADCISSVFDLYGKCFRTGGDEFIVLANVGRGLIPVLTGQVMKKASEWHGKKAPSLSLSVGSAEASKHPGTPIEKLVSAADLEMYKAKNEYYRENEIDRRRF